MLCEWMLVVAAAASFAPGRGGEDLAAAYPTHAVRAGQREGLECESTPADVWRLRSFTLESRKRFRLRLGASHLIVGHHEGSALWAVVIPERPAKIVTDLPGEKESACSVLLRFHPSRVGDLFPLRTVSPSGDRNAHAWGTMIEGHKRRGRWSRQGQPFVVGRDEVVVDVDTKEGTRRVYVFDLDTGRVRYDGSYVTRALPRGTEIDSNVAGRVFDRACSLLAERYGPLEELDEESWEELRMDQRRDASRSRTRLELGVALHALLDTFHDPRLRVRAGELYLPSFATAPTVPNVNWDGVVNILGTIEYERTLWRARTPNGVGYLALGWIGEETEAEFDEALAELRDTWTLILDLRRTGGDDGRVAMELAGRLLDEDVVWARRAGEDGELEELRCKPRGAWRYRAPVLVLVGPGTRSYGERLALAASRAPQVTLLGAPTLGHELFIDWVPVGEDMSIRIPELEVFDEEGVRLDRGVPVDVALESDPDDYHDDPDEDLRGVDEGDRDPVLFSALEHALRTPSVERRTAQELAEDR